MNETIHPSAISERIDGAEVLSDGENTPILTDENNASPARGKGRPKGARNRKREKQADGFIGLMDDCDLWRDQDGEPFVTFTVGNHRENWKINSKQFRSWLSAKAYEAAGSVPGQEAISAALSVQAARAYKGPVFDPARRVAGLDGRIYIDLCNADWQVIEIDRKGWRLVDHCPVKFIRSPAMRPLPMPAEDDGGQSAINRLWEFCNLETERDFILISAWLVASLRERGPYPMLIVNGPQGSGKSTFTKLIRSLVDPSKSPIRSAPKDDRDIFVAAVNSHVIALDNVSRVEPWLSDGLCRIATGGGFGTRALHTDTDEIVFDGARPIILNGIPHLTERPDLAERSITVRLREIGETDRGTEREYWSKWAEAQPQVLGAILIGVSAALRNLSRVRLEGMLRMADFCEWAEAASSGLGFKEGQFMEAYRENSKDVAEGTFESSLVAVTVLEMLSHEPGDRFEGNASALLAKLDAIATDAVKKQRSWPQTAISLGRALERIAPILKQRGISCEFRKSNGRAWTLQKISET